MSSLWVNGRKLTNKKIGKPSPANKRFFAQKPLSQPPKNTYKPIEKISLFIASNKSKKICGSMTVEAAVLLPLLMFMFLHLSSVLEMLRLHGKLETALWNVGNHIALYTHTFSENMDTIPNVGVTRLLVHNQVKALLGKEYLEHSPLVSGEAGLNYLCSDYLNEEECVDIFVTYQIKPKITILPFGYKRMSNRYYARAWTGYKVTGHVRYVYVTPQGEVWHSTPECTYIYHQITSVPFGEIENCKNFQGKLYTECEFCKEFPEGHNVYITMEGERYHRVRSCTAIYKRIFALEWNDGLPYRACTRCGTEKEE